MACCRNVKASRHSSIRRRASVATYGFAVAASSAIILLEAIAPTRTDHVILTAGKSTVGSVIIEDSSRHLCARYRRDIDKDIGVAWRQHRRGVTLRTTASGGLSSSAYETAAARRLMKTINAPAAHL